MHFISLLTVNHPSKMKSETKFEVLAIPHLNLKQKIEKVAVM